MSGFILKRIPVTSYSNQGFKLAYQDLKETDSKTKNKSVLFWV